MTNINTRIIDSFIINKAKTYSDYKKNVEKMLEEGIKDAQTWENVCRRLGLQKAMRTDKAYKGINQMVLGMVAFAKGYEDTRWLTFNDIKAHNEQKQNKDKQWKLKAKDSEKGYQNGDQKCVEIMYFIPRYMYELTEDGKIDFRHGKAISEEEYKALSEKDKKRVFTKTIKSFVFNAEQVDGIEPLAKETKKFSVKLIEHIAKKMNLGLNFESKDSPCYIPSRDTVSMPKAKLFKNQRYLYASALHEFSHATGHKSRLNRELKGMFGSSDYAFEELVAESSATMLCAYLGIEKEVDKNHKAYIKSWLGSCKDNKTALIEAFKLAEKACDYIIQEADLENYEEKVVATEEVVEEKKETKKAKKTAKKSTKSTKKAETEIAKPKKTTKKASNLVMTSNVINGIEILRFELTKEDGNIEWLEMTKDFYLKMSKKDKKQMEKAWGIA